MIRSRIRPVRLTDIPPPVRMKAAREAAAVEDRLPPEDLLLAAICPSEQVYWVPEDAVMLTASTLKPLPSLRAPKQHGTEGMYRAGCKCVPCRNASAEARRQRRQAAA